MSLQASFDVFGGSAPDCSVHGSAIFSEDGQFRFVLSRWWGAGPRALIMGANPSKAGWPENDPTVHRIIALTRQRWSGLDLVNETPLISTDPAGVMAWRAVALDGEVEAVLARNEAIVRQLAETAAARIVACGNLVSNLAKSRVVDALSYGGRYPLYAFGLTKDGAPKHPLARGKSWISADEPLIVWKDAAP